MSVACFQMLEGPDAGVSFQFLEIFLASRKTEKSPPAKKGINSQKKGQKAIAISRERFHNFWVAQSVFWHPGHGAPGL